jgi:chromosome segregation ATPase
VIFLTGCYKGLPQPGHDEFMSDIESLERRVAALEQEVEGEKAVTRYILDQTRRNGDDLAAIRSRLDRIEARLDRHDARFDRLEAELRSLRADLPRMIAETMREVLRERDR